MANPTMPTAALLVNPGFLYYAPLGSTLPTPVSTASKFSDVWPVAWLPLGLTDKGTTFERKVTSSPVYAEEQLEALQYFAVNRENTVSFDLKNFTATNLFRAMNGGTMTVAGTGATTITTINPPILGAEVRCMIGFETLDSTYRFVAYQVFNEVDLKLAFQKAPANTPINWMGRMEKPTGAQDPFIEYTAGAARG